MNSLKPKSLQHYTGAVDQICRKCDEENTMKDEIEGDDISGEVNRRERGLEKGSYKRRKI